MRGQNTSQDCFVANTLVNPPPLPPPFFSFQQFRLHLPKLSQIGGNDPIFARLTKHLPALFRAPLYTPPLEGEQAGMRAPLLPVLRAPVNMVTMDVTT